MTFLLPAALYQILCCLASWQMGAHADLSGDTFEVNEFRLVNGFLALIGFS